MQECCQELFPDSEVPPPGQGQELLPPAAGGPPHGHPGDGQEHREHQH